MLAGPATASDEIGAASPGADLTGGISALPGRGARRQLRRAKARLERRGVTWEVYVTRSPDDIIAMRQPVTAAWLSRSLTAGRAPSYTEWQQCWEQATEAAVLLIGGVIAAWDLARVDGGTRRVLASQTTGAFRGCSPGRLLEEALLCHARETGCTHLDWGS